MFSVFPVIIPSGGVGLSEESKKYIQSSKFYQFISNCIDSFQSFLDNHDINFFDLVIPIIFFASAYIVIRTVLKLFK